MNKLPLIEETMSLAAQPIRVSTQCLRQRNYLHMHEHIQICYVLSGTLRHTIDDREYIQTPNSCSIVLPFVKHMTDLVDSEDTPIVVFISFWKEFLTDFGVDFFPYHGEKAVFEGFRIPQMRIFETERARELIHKMIDIYSRDDRATLASLLKTFLSLACTEKSKNLPSAVFRSKTYSVCNVIEYITKNYNEKLCIDDMAALGNMSRSTFTSNFKSLTGLSFLDFLTAARLSVAVALKQNYGAQLEDIAKQTGLHNRTNITRVAKKHLGFSIDGFIKYRKDSMKAAEKNISVFPWMYEEE